MKELLATIKKWKQEKRSFTLSRVIHTWGSSPRPVGSAMLVDQDGNMAGSVSGGCVEGAVIKASREILDNATPKRLHFGVSDEEAWTVGLTCGGKVQVFQQLMMSAQFPGEYDLWAEMISLLENDQDFVLITPLQETKVHNTIIKPDGTSIGKTVSSKLHHAALEAYDQRNHQVLEDEGSGYFIQVFPRKSQLLIIGSAHITADLVSFAKIFDFQTVVIDPRGVFAQKTEYHQAPDELIEEYPSEVLTRYTLDANSYAVILSHDPKIDDNALSVLLSSDVAYIGALGSRKTHEKRINRLTKSGYSQKEIERIRAPIGLPIKAKTPAEIALCIMAEIIAEKNKHK